MNWSTYPPHVNDYRRSVLEEENASWPRHVILCKKDTWFETLKTTALQKAGDGRWRQPESLHHYDPSGDLPEHCRILIERLHGAISQLPRRERTIIRLYYVKGYSQEQIAARVHCCRRRVGQLLKQSIAEIRSNLSNLLHDETGGTF